MRVGSLFAGIGGFDLAAESAGMTVAWQSENDQPASKVLAHHWPDVPNLGDVHGVTGPPAVDVLTGGFPCQDYSVAGKGAGLAGDRGALWWQFHRLIAECRPTWVVGENVHGLTTRKHRDALRTIIGSLVQLGYGVVWRVLDAQWFGVAQRRRRVFIVGHSGGQPRPEVLALAQGVSGDTPPSREPGKGSAPTLAARTRGGGGLGTDTELDGGLIAGEVATALKATGTYDHVGDEARLVAFNPYRTLEKDGSITSGFAPRPIVDALHGPTGNKEPLIAFSKSRGDGTSREAPTPGSLDNSPPSPREVAQPLRSNPHNNSDPGMEASMHIYQGSTVRRLTPLECERLQGFPDHWTATLGNSDSQRYKQLGNAVAVPVVEWIMSNIAKAPLLAEEPK